MFTVPYYRGRPTRVRARPGAGGGVEHLLPPEYHGNPIDKTGSLVATEWGDEIADVIYGCSGLTTTIHHYHDRRRGLVAEFLDVFVSRKPPAPDAAPRPDR